jgi:hypothetical protein
MGNGTSSASFQEPTLSEQQRRGFEYLRDKARSAHNEGDGLLVNQLSIIALCELVKLSKTNSLHLQLAELRWAYVFTHYWLVDEYVLGTEIREALEHAPKSSEVDAALLEMIKHYNILIREPLWTPPETASFLQNSRLEWVTTDSPPEDLSLIEHMIELLWYREQQGESWKAVIKSWSILPALPTRCKELLHRLDKRLTLQSSLATPGPRFTPVRLEDAKRWNEDFPEAELWIHALNGDRMGLNDAIARRLPFVSDNPVLVRLLLDFQHLFGPWSNKDTAIEKLDSQAIRLARRRMFENPLLKFNETREQSLSNLLGTIFQRDESRSAYLRFHAFRLGMLSELAALRLWDFGEWRDSLRAQSNACLEVARWENNPIDFAANWVRLSVIALSYESERKYASQALGLLDFSTAATRTKLIQEILFLYPLQGRKAVEALDDFSDAIPEALWDQTASWCIRFFNEGWNSNEKSTGWKMLPLQFWGDIFPCLSATSPIWEKMTPIVVREAQSPLHWHSDERGFFLHFLLYAPFEKARAVGTTMVGVQDGDPVTRNRRFKIIQMACEKRNDLAPEFLPELNRMAENPLQKWQLGLKLSRGTVHPDAEQEAKNYLRPALDEYINRAKPGGKPSYPMRLDVESMAQMNWKEEDEPWLQLVLQTINDPTVLVTAIPPLLYALSVLLGHGPRAFAERAHESVLSVLRSLPNWRPDPNQIIGGPLSAVSFDQPQGGELENALASVAYELRRTLSADIDGTLSDWVLNTSAKSDVATGPNLTQLTLALATRQQAGSAEGREQLAEQATQLRREAMLDACRSVLQSAWNRYRTDHTQVHDLFWGVRAISWSIRNTPDCEIDWSQIDSSVLRSLLGRLRTLLQQLALCPHPLVRAEVAKALRRFSVWLALPQELESCLTGLASDSRARVRRASTADLKES